jgi:hypothetical protein
MPDADTYKWYLYDLGLLLKESALQAKVGKEESRGTEDYDYNMGVLHAYMYVLSLMQGQAKSFGIPLEDLQLADITPEVDLL